jgi:allophanate hydrolase subunit 2
MSGRGPARRAGDEAGGSWPAVTGDPFVDRDPDRPIGLLPGTGAGLEALLGETWRAGSASDRVGIRLEGPAVADASGGELLSHGVVHGAIQLPPGGTPIVMLADHQTTGGYPIAAVVMTADHPRLGQLRPGASVRFVAVSLAEAREALARQRAALDLGTAMLREQAGWDDLWQSAGG